MITEQKKADIIEDLRGTCQTLNVVLEKHEAEELEDDKQFLEELDNTVFCCECCGWWYEIWEMSDSHSWECVDCYPEDDE